MVYEAGILTDTSYLQITDTVVHAGADVAAGVGSPAWWLLRVLELLPVCNLTARIGAVRSGRGGWCLPAAEMHPWNLNRFAPA